MVTAQFPDGYSKPTVFKTWAQVVARPKVAIVHPEMLRRVGAMCRAAFNEGVSLGIGGAGRLEGEQDALYRRRHHVTPADLPPCARGDHGFYQGKCWTENEGVADAAKPGVSFHELCPMASGQPYVLALDMVGDMAWMGKNLKRFGLYTFKSEPWHIQPVEIPASRADYVPAKHVLKVFALPGSQPQAPAPPTSTPPNPPAMPVTVKAIRRGDTGVDVYLAQVILLQRAKQLIVVPTGTFDAFTETAVKSFQQFFGLTVDGKIGLKETWPMLHYIACAKPEVDEDGA